MRLRVVTYNVRSFRAGVGLAVEAIGNGAPDLVLVQEYGPPHRLRWFARALGMQAKTSFRPFNRMRNAVLWRAPWRLEDATIGSLIKTPGQYRRGFVAVTLVHPDGASLVAVGTHLGLSARERPAHAEELLGRLPTTHPLILGGDLNDTPESAAVALLTRTLADAQSAAGDAAAPTFPARTPTTRIDYVLVSAGVRPVSCTVAVLPAAARASDHLPVVAEVELLPRA
ncbi:MAG TPA: endonuclease/exonuclease/phosphatase family protein [Actinomycetota bacterium]|nr:endonuclease/exonuclease/phosphatase family protein [Actinomycetota bacterium]